MRCFVQYSFDSPQKYFREMFSDMFFYIDTLAVLPTYIDMLTTSNSDGLQILKAGTRLLTHNTQAHNLTRFRST